MNAPFQLLDAHNCNSWEPLGTTTSPALPATQAPQIQLGIKRLAQGHLNGRYGGRGECLMLSFPSLFVIHANNNNNNHRPLRQQQLLSWPFLLNFLEPSAPQQRETV